MEKAIEWVKNHKQHTAAIVIVVVAVIAVLIAAASGAFTQQDKTKDAIKKGDETLKGDAGTGILNKLDGNVNANPNVSDKPSTPAHQHSWKQHTAQRWVSNMVTVPDYETQKVYGARFYVPTDVPGQYIAKGPEYWFENGFTRDDLKAIIYNAMKNADENGLYNGVSYSSYQNITKTVQVQVGSHQEDHGHYETYVDYEYCDCGVTRFDDVVHRLRLLLCLKNKKSGEPES